MLRTSLVISFLLGLLCFSVYAGVTAADKEVAVQRITFEYVGEKLCYVEYEVRVKESEFYVRKNMEFTSVNAQRVLDEVTALIISKEGIE